MLLLVAPEAGVNIRKKMIEYMKFNISLNKLFKERENLVQLYRKEINKLRKKQCVSRRNT